MNYFDDIPLIPFKGPDSRDPLSFRHYDSEQMVGKLRMKEHLNFSIAYWHSFCNGGTDPFGLPTFHRPWNESSDPMRQAESRVHAFFELAEKLSLPYFCFHDRDLAPEGDSITESNKNLDRIAAIIEGRMNDSPVRVLFGTANLFSHPRYMHGAATSPDLRVYAHAATQVKKAMEITHRLKGRNYVFWGGREGYESLLNTDMKREMDQMAAFFHMAIAHAKRIGFTGQLLIEPKPKEPTKHQYDFDVATVIGFLEHYGLTPFLKCNIETNHATLAGHTLAHELHLARIHNLLGSVDANQGDPLLGWDTDQFPTDVRDASLAMYEILKNGGLHQGGLNFDAKVRRGSWELTDIVYAHISGMDTFAKALKVAHALQQDAHMEDLMEKRYESYRSSLGQKISERTTDFTELEAYAMKHPVDRPESGHQEMLEQLLSYYIDKV